MKVLGIDPGLANMGLCVVELKPRTEEVVFLEVLTTEKSNKKQNILVSSDTFRRCREMAASLNRVLVQQNPSIIAVESMSFPRNASSAAKTAVTWGIIGTLAELYDLPVVQASPQEIKKCLCGKRTASKLDVQAELKLHFPDAFQSFVERYPQSKHEHGFDAVGVVFACLSSEVVRMARGMSR